MLSPKLDIYLLECFSVQRNKRIVQIHAKPTLIILKHEPRNLKREISPNNAKHHKQEASMLVSTSIVQITFITSEQRFLF